MGQCLIYNESLRFSRATYGVMLLIAILIRNQWLVLLAATLIILGVFTLKLNIPYQLHKLIRKNKIAPMPKELGELNFVAGATGMLLLIGFALVYFNKFVDFAWAYLLIVDLMIFLACFVGFCVATLTYIFFKKLFGKNKNNLQ
ncbi:MAG: hypothetical protein A2373_03190 [Candidatus Magasanikbacteria bacterium RIFOXYB1_FULL_40_15]|uniref:DUF4395 domain-containing protein n=1 Tax=Candidatus Magasanikbacteria bacterium RIFOXYB1_FULL_40_15 TaxID=1798697 RepID=A0A1F6NEZ7_9BACT|nr:MAG: hypothetical protein A2373_03190 [Candidatus Magasanikbacteria bacterium RIFOXYB1_FULL_40_15]